ncbi:hypothetical protein NDU88_002240 [Pleurodeles waltl]|uniref:Uncharacterized protein n=1 Tax=Pleurodeles waltl TaxID=8319 RepID=A0AAV7MN71_PLEWA|nr:hypothetical protein NDU88_002240 [Pleurodeles waltl]
MVVLRRAPMLGDMTLCVLKPFAQVTKFMLVQKWKGGGCELLGELCFGEEFITQADAIDSFELGLGPYLQYAKLAAMARDLWLCFP